VSEAKLIAGAGIEGDRYAAWGGTFSDWPGDDHQLTLIEAEALEAVEAEFGLRLAPGVTRRNVTTRGVRLNNLVGRRFRLGTALCEGTRRCEPCAHLERVTGIGGLARMLAYRGGLRARILEDGVVRVGDAVQEEVDG
jgi:MOSC domain-containing protein YiiM